jgi:hypothetical protein
MQTHNALYTNMLTCHSLQGYQSGLQQTIVPLHPIISAFNG